jgi:hypothetical protein
MLGHELPEPKSTSSADVAAQVGGRMRQLKLLWLALVQLFIQAWSLPHYLVMAVKQREKRAVLHALELERLDRLRNPTKYQGKS